MTNRPLSVSAALFFLLLNALLWLVFGAIITLDAHPALPDHPHIKWVMAILSLVTSGVFLGLFIFLRKRNPNAYYLATILFFAISLLTIFDDFGLADLVVVTLNIVPMIFLIKDRGWYLWEGTMAHFPHH